jgi:DNA ligase (NAD+)
MNIKELEEKIDQANHTYYTDGNAIFEDAYYDKLKEQLKALDPNNSRLTQTRVAIRDSILEKRKHTIPMDSLSKALNEAEWLKWLKGAPRICGGELLHASFKMDGGTYSFEYKNGKLVCVISGGDGFVGEDVTANALKFKNLPKTVQLGNNKTFSGFVRGEVVLEMDDWKAVDPELTSNPRNLAVGIARRKDGTESEYLKVYAFRCFDEDGTPFGDTELEISQNMENMGFDVAPYKTGDAAEVWDWYLLQQKERPKLPFWIDGIVIKINDIERQLELGESSECPKGQVAIKFPAEGAKTILRSVNLQVGHTGTITPVANFDTIRLGIANVENANLCNYNNIETLGVAIGDEIYVIKAGDIIPRIMEVLKEGKNRQKIEEPKKCPVCNGKVGHKENASGVDSSAIYCLNNNCPAVVSGRIDKYVSSLDIKGVSTSVIEALIKYLNVKDAADLYTLGNDIERLVDLQFCSGVRLGGSRAHKILKEIDKKKELTLGDFLGSLGISGLGKRRVVLIQEAVPGEFDTLDDWINSNNLTKFAVQAGIPNLAARIQADIHSQKDYIKRFIKNGVQITYKAPKKALKEGAYMFCITGSLSQPKAHFEELITKAGHGYSATFCSAVTHVVAADPNSGSGKLRKASEKGIKVISEAELLKLIA